jgi:TonB family protein
VQAGIGVAALMVLISAWVIGTSGSADPAQAVAPPPTELSRPRPAVVPVAEVATPAEPTPTDVVAGDRTFRITTRPSGARVWIDGTELGGATPVDVPLEMNVRYRIQIEQVGRQRVDWAFTPAELADSTLASGQLFFPLRPQEIESLPDVPPALLGTEPVPAPIAEPGVVALPAPDNAPVTDEVLPPVEPVRVRGPRMTAAEVVDKWEPELPGWAADAELPGFVVLELVIDREGRLRSSRVLRAVHPELEAMAIEAAKRWVFEPARNESEPVDAYLNVSVQFRRD